MKAWEGFEAVLIDASRLRFAVPTFLLRLQTFIDWHRARGKRVTLIAPNGANVATYLSRMHVDKGHRRGTRGLPAIREHERSDVLLPITRLHDQSEVEALNDVLGPLLESHDDEVAVLANALHTAIAELCGNAVDHGASEHGCYVAAQRYRRGPGGRRLVLAIGDLGIGVPNHLRRIEPNLRPDRAALARAVEEGVSGTGNPHRGYGFHWVMEEARGTALRFARLQIRSGRGHLTTTLRRRAMRTTSVTVGNKTGTWIMFEVGV